MDLGKPEFINEKGVKWWRDKSLTEYAHRENSAGITLPNLTVWIVETLDGTRTRMFIRNKKPIYTNPSLEACAVHIDILKRLEMDKPKKQRSAVAKDLRTPKYRKRVVADKKKRGSKLKCRKNGRKQ